MENEQRDDEKWKRTVTTHSGENGIVAVAIIGGNAGMTPEKTVKLGGTVGDDDDDDYADSRSSKAWRGKAKQCKCRLQFALELKLLYITAAPKKKKTRDSSNG